MKSRRVCPIVIRRKRSRCEILVFRHPETGIQIVKGGIKTGEKPKMAALRELKEESGIKSVRSIAPIGVWRSNHKEQIWIFYKCRASKKLPDTWEFFCNDDGGHLFEFFWINPRRKPQGDWAPAHKRSLKFLRKNL